MKKESAIVVVLCLFAFGQVQLAVPKESASNRRGKINLIQNAKTNIQMEFAAGSWTLNPRLKPVGLLAIPTSIGSGSLGHLRYDLCFNELVARGSVDGRSNIKLAESTDGDSYSVAIEFLNEAPDFKEIAKARKLEDFGKEYWIRPEIDSGYFSSGVFWRSGATGILRILWIEGKVGQKGIKELAVWVGNLDESDCSVTR